MSAVHNSKTINDNGMKFGAVIENRLILILIN